MSRTHEALVILRGPVAINGVIIELNTELELTIDNLDRVESINAFLRFGSYEVVVRRARVILVISEQEDDESRVVVRSVLRLDDKAFEPREIRQDGEQA